MKLPTPVTAPPHFDATCVVGGEHIYTHRQPVFPHMLPFTFTCEEHAIRFRDRFASPFDQYAEHRGKGFTVIGCIAVPDDTHDAENVPMWNIRLDDGTEIEAWPVEVVVDPDLEGQVEEWWYEPTGSPA